MKLLIILLALTISASNLRAQNKGSINGVAKDLQNNPLASATVSLFTAIDTTPTAVRITKENGRYDFAGLAEGEYTFTISHVGFRQYRSGALAINSAHRDILLPAVILQPEKSIVLNEVVIKSKRPLLVQDIDKTIVNVDAMISSATSNTLEVLEKTPGITVSITGEISLNGKSGVVVLIDGRATYMSAQDLSAYLKSLPGSIIDKIELMDNPPSKYDASGNAIINIRLKRNRLAGYTGSVAAGYSQGAYARHNETANLNYNYKKVNLFANLSYNDEKNYNQDDYQRKFYGDNKLLNSSASLQNLQRNRSYNLSARLGMDYFVSPKTTWGVILNINGGPRNGYLQYMSNSFNNVDAFDSSGYGTTFSTDKRTNTGANLNYLHKFNNNGRELSADLNYFNYRSSGYQALENSNYLPDGSLKNTSSFYYELPSNIDIYTVKADYIHPLKNNAGLEAGLKSNFVDNDNNSQYFATNAGINALDYTRSNHFIYRENVNAAYINARKNWKRVGIQFGLRSENTNIRGTQAGNAVTAGSSFSKNYTDVFPTAFISYKLDSTGTNTLTASVARRINRPNYQYLNPFVMFRDNYSYTSGNSQLNPQYQYQTQVKYQHKQWLGLGVQYGQFTNIIFQTTRAVNNIFITSPQNVSSGFMVVLSANLALNPTDWWNANVNMNVAHMELNGMVDSEKLNPGTTTSRINIINQFMLEKGWSAELSGAFNGRDIQGQSIVRARTRVYAGVQKKFWNDRASVRISLEDIFHSWTQNDHAVNIKQAESVHYYETDSQRMGIGFTFRFGKDNSNRKSKHADNAADTEKGRLD